MYKWALKIMDLKYLDKINWTKANIGLNFVDIGLN